MKHSGETILGGTSRNMSEGGYGNAGEHPERLRSGEENDVSPLFPEHSQSSETSVTKSGSLLERSSPVSLPPEAKNYRPQGGTTGERAIKQRLLPHGSKPSSIAADQPQDSGILQLRLFDDLPEYISHHRKKVSEMESLSEEVRDGDIQFEIPDFMKMRYPR
ncbi:hypothetical protein [Pontiella sulfatireligans]|uniref:Uncharacterized protein n=1 Tax=Pontiella sulfatireligans TaxID=2750658 RepID=A0A6C2UP42_9BACT|nr:hypothetical protein [Pontiella sulfatireligans]VGO21713.1 hypothetical protein SCARR_03787 [Pontiella sulfatireligans]